MRVVVYVPTGPGAERTRRAVAREVERQGHEVVGYARTPREAEAMRAAGLCDRIAGRGKHLAELAPWMLPVRPRRKIPPAVVAVPLAAVAWWLAHRRPALVTGALAFVAATVAAVALMPGGETPNGSPGAERRRPPPLPTTVPTPTVETPPPPPVPVAIQPLPPPPTTVPVSPPAPPPSSEPAPVETPTCRLVADLDLLTVSVEVCVDQPNG